jgi:polar amino acid transport system substrate-binding protein
MGKYLKFLSIVAVVMVLVVAGCGPAAAPTVTPVPTKAAAPAPAPTPAPPPLASGALLTPGEISLAADFTAKPSQFMDEKGNMDGFNPALCNEIATRLGLKPKWTNLAWAGLIPGLQSKRFDALCTGVFITDERKQIMNMVPYVKWGEGMLVPFGNPKKITCNYTQGNDDSYGPCYEKLAGLKVASSPGSTVDVLLRKWDAKSTAKGLPPMQILEFDDFAGQYQALLSGQVDATICDDVHCAYVAAEYPTKLEVSWKGNEFRALALTTLKENVSLAKALQWALVQMKADGTYLPILTKWGVSPVDSFDF